MSNGIFTPLEKICLLLTNLVFWVVVCAVVDNHYEDAVNLFFGSIVVSTLFLILQEGKEMDTTAMKKRMQRCKNAGSITHYRGRQVATCNPESLSIERRALIEAEELLQRAGAGALFSVYQSLTERYGSLIVLLPVSQSITDPLIAQFLRELELIKLVITNDNKSAMYCLSWYYGIPAKKAKAEVAQMFVDDAEKALRDVREMLIYSLHLIQIAQQEMQAYQSSALHQEKIANWEIIKKHLNYPSMADREIEAAKRNIPHGGADLLSVEDERLYNYITSAFARQIADSQGAYAEHQRWRRELLLSLGQDDSAGSGGLSIGL